MDNIKFKFKAYQENKNIVVHVIVDGAEAIFRYSDPEAVSAIAENMKQILDYAIEDYLIRKKFKDQLENELDDWLKNEG